MSYYTADNGNDYYHWSGGPVGYSPPGPPMNDVLLNYDFEYHENLRIQRDQERKKERKEAWERHLVRWRNFKKFVRNTTKRILKFFRIKKRKKYLF